MNSYEIGAIILLAAAIHASFQLSVSMLTLMSGHALGKKTAHTKLLRLMAGFTLGAMVMILLGVSFLSLLVQNLFPDSTPLLAWSAVCGLVVGVGVAVWGFYYRHRTVGTVLWLPRPMAQYIAARARAARNPAEAFGLGLSSIIAELLFAIAPMLVAALLLARLDTPLQLAGVLGYTLVATAPLLLITMLVGGGRSLGVVQRWRETNKRFLQFAAGSALVILGGYLYVDIIVSQLTIASGGAV